jgi:ElaB/YqjD/DUF883 family membrane-anchored ribosome-binding protein
MGHTTVGEFDRAKGKVTDDLKALIGDGQELLKATANASGERIAAVREQFAEHALSARTRLAELSQPLVERAGRVDAYVHANTWTALAVAAVAGVWLGLLVAKR